MILKIPKQTFVLRSEVTYIVAVYRQGRSQRGEEGPGPPLIEMLFLGFKLNFS